MARERLSLLQKQILGIYQEKSRQLNIKETFGFSRVGIARHLQNKTGKTYQIIRRPRYADDNENSAEIMKKMFLIVQTETAFDSGKIDKATKEKTIKQLNDSLSPDARDLLNFRREVAKLHKDYDKKQVSLTRSLKSLVEKKILFISSASDKKLAYFITQKGLDAKLGEI